MKTSFYVKSLPPVPLGPAEERSKDKEYLVECKIYVIKLNLGGTFFLLSAYPEYACRKEMFLLGEDILYSKA